MPELPEVESVVRSLRGQIVDKVIQDVEVLWNRSVHTPSPHRFKSLLLGKRFESFDRRGKFILAHLSDGLTLITHLRMSGRLVTVHETPVERRHLRIQLYLRNSHSLCFYDVRKFGRMYLVRDPELILGKLGPDPMKDNLGSEDWLDMLRSKSGAIKPLLLRQDFLAGLGNIYVDEALWRARIHPQASTRSVSRVKALKLLRDIIDVFLEAIEANGTDFGDGVIDSGRYEPSVYGRTGEPCQRCEAKLRRIVVAGRGTHFCYRCQRL